MRLKIIRLSHRLIPVLAGLALGLAVTAGLSAAEATSASAVGAMELRQQVTLSGTIHDFRPSSRPNVPNSFQLKDQTGTVRVAVWPNVFDEIPFRSQIRNGIRLRVTGDVAQFRGAKEVHVRGADGLELLDPPAATPAATAAAGTTAAPAESRSAPLNNPDAGRINEGISAVAQLTRDRLQESFTIEGKMTSGRRPSTPTAPYVLRVADPTGSIDVVFWDDVASQLPDSKRVEVGDKVQVTGELGEHRGSLQLRVREAEGIKTPKSDPTAFRPDTPAENSATTPTAGASAQPIQAMNPADLETLPVGSRVSIAGRVTSVEAVRLGKKIRLQADGQTTSPQALLLLWDTAHGLKPEVRYVKTSSTLSVAGTVAEAIGEKALVVTEPEQVLAVEP